MPKSCESQKPVTAIEFEYYLPKKLPDCLLMDLDHARIVEVFPDGTRVVSFKGDQFFEMDFRIKGSVFRIDLPTFPPTAKTAAQENYIKS